MIHKSPELRPELYDRDEYEGVEEVLPEAIIARVDAIMEGEEDDREWVDPNRGAGWPKGKSKAKGKARPKVRTVAKPKPKGTARHPRPAPVESPRASSSPPNLRDVLVTGNDEEWRAHTRKVLVEGAPAPATQSARQCAWRQWGL